MDVSLALELCGIEENLSFKVNFTVKISVHIITKKLSDKISDLQANAADIKGTISITSRSISSSPSVGELYTSDKNAISNH